MCKHNQNLALIHPYPTSRHISSSNTIRIWHLFALIPPADIFHAQTQLEFGPYSPWSHQQIYSHWITTRIWHLFNLIPPADIFALDHSQNLDVFEPWLHTLVSAISKTGYPLFHNGLVPSTRRWKRFSWASSLQHRWMNVLSMLHALFSTLFTMLLFTPTLQKPSQLFSDLWMYFIRTKIFLLNWRLDILVTSTSPKFTQWSTTTFSSDGSAVLMGLTPSLQSTYISITPRTHIERQTRRLHLSDGCMARAPGICWLFSDLSGLVQTWRDYSLSYFKTICDWPASWVGRRHWLQQRCGYCRDNHRKIQQVIQGSQNSSTFIAFCTSNLNYFWSWCYTFSGGATDISLPTQ